MTPAERKELRRLAADYMQSEGCSCCRDTVAHLEHQVALAELLNVRKYSDGSGYDFNRYATRRL